MDAERGDEALMLAYGAGDATAFEVLYGRWRGRVYRYLQHQCGNAALAEEIYQDVWLKVVAARGQYEVTAKFSTWLFRIARNRMIDHWRLSGRRIVEYQADEEEIEDDHDALAERSEAATPASAAPDRMLERRELAERMIQAISELPDAQRETFLLSEEGEMTLEEIAVTTGTSRETAKSRLRYALAKLRDSLKEWR